MAAPVASYVQLPIDTANTGKKNRTHTKVVGSDTVHEHFLVPSKGFTTFGRYIASTTVANVVSSAAQTGTGSGVVWLHNSTANTAVGMLHKVEITYSQEGTAAIFQSAPRYSLQKFTFATAFSGTTLNIVPTQTSTTTPKANIRSTSSGATVTLVGPIGSRQIPALVSTAGTYGGEFTVYNSGQVYERGDAVEFGPGEGIVLFQVTSGNAADTRQITARLEWSEIDVS
jgi:hypothetical protein